jgi:transposase
MWLSKQTQFQTKGSKMSKANISYQGKKIYVGIDVHKKTYAVTVICGREIVKRDSLLASPEGLVQYLKKFFKGARIFTVYEAGFSGFRLHRVLTQSGIKNILINPASLETAANDKVKNDRRDSKKLAEQLSDGRLKGIYVPTEAEELRRAITRTREQVVNHRVQVGNQIKSKLHYFGIIHAEEKNRKISRRYLIELEKAGFPEELAYSIKILIEQWKFFSMQLLELRRELRKQAKVDSKLEEIYRSVPGVGPISARVFANELGDLSQRFSNERELFKYTGLTPSEHSSGETVHRGEISRQGSPRVRHMLTEVAWRAVAVDPALKEIFLRIAATRGKKRAIVAIARKLIGRIRACFRMQTVYALGMGV